MVRSISGPQKAAILLLAMGEESAGEVLQNLTEPEIRQLVHYMSEIEEVSARDVDRVTNEFYLIAERKNFVPGPPETKVGFLRKILNRALGQEQADKLVDGMLSSGADSALEQLKWHAPSTIAEFLGGEHPQVIAAILANLGDPQLAIDVIARLPDDMQQDVYRRLAQYKSISQELLDEIEGSLREEFQQQPPAHHPEPNEGTEKVADLLSATPRPMEAKLMNHLEHENPELAGKIRKQMLPFEDFIKIDNFGIQKILEASTNEDLVLALKTASEPLQRHFFRNMSTTSAERIQEALGQMGPTRIADIEAAQKRLAATAGRLNDEGQLTILHRKNG
jgi:flagellar motor switch protein FliG